MIWTRVSTLDQLRNSSLNIQLDYCTEYAENLGFQIIHHETAYESAKDENEKFRAMIKKVADPRNNYDALIVQYASRFSRNMSVASSKMMMLKKKGIHIHAVEEKVNSETKKGEIFLNSAFNNANNENYEKSDRVIRSRLARLKLGVSIGKPPLGYIAEAKKSQLDSENKLLPSVKVCGAKGLLVKKAFKLILKGKTLTETCDEINNLGLDITRKYLGEILRKPFYCGKLIDKSLIDDGIPFVWGKHEKIISPAEFDRVQKLLNRKALKRNKKTDENRTPLNGLLKCPNCQKNITSYVTKGNSYYKCNHGCKFNISSKAVHAKANEVLGSLRITQPTIEEVKKIANKMYQERFSDLIKQQETKEREIAKLKTRLENLLIQNLDGEIDKPTYNKIKQDSEKQIVVLKEELIKIKLPKIKNLQDAVLDCIVNPSTLYESLDVHDKKILMRVIFKKGITFNKEAGDFENISVNPIFTDENKKILNRCAA